MNTTQEFIEHRLFHEIHVSEIREFQKCNWAWYWKYMEKWYPLTHAKPLEFGTAMHAAMEARYNPKHYDQKDIAEALAITTLADTNQKQFEAAKAAKGIFFDESVVDDYNERRDLGIRMLQYYFEAIVDKEKDFKPVAVEQNFIVPIEDDMGVQLYCYCAQCLQKWQNRGDDVITSRYIFPGLPVVLEGKIDLILEYDNGKVWVRDWKNIGRFSDSVEWLENDLQLTLYLWALWKMNADIGGFEYFESKKMAPEIPEPMKRRNKGKLYSTAKDNPYEYESYLKEIMNGDPLAYEDGLYEEYLNWLKAEGPQYYRITRVRKTEKSMRMVQGILQEIAIAITSTREGVRKMYPSPTKFGCIYCDFRQPCIERMNGQPYYDMMNSLFVQKEKHYYE